MPPCELTRWLPWDHPEAAFGPLRRLLVDTGPPFKEDRSGKGLVRICTNVDRGIVRGETAMTLAILRDAESYDEFLVLVKKDPHPPARAQAAWALGELGRAEAIEPLKTIAKTLPPEEQSNVLAFNLSGAIERLEFVRDHSGENAETVAAARAVCRLAGWPENQVKCVEPALSSLRALEPTRTKLLEAWSADHRRPTIARVSNWHCGWKAGDCGAWSQR